MNAELSPMFPDIPSTNETPSSITSGGAVFNYKHINLTTSPDRIMRSDPLNGVSNKSATLDEDSSSKTVPVVDSNVFKSTTKIIIKENVAQITLSDDELEDDENDLNSPP